MRKLWDIVMVRSPSKVKMLDEDCANNGSRRRRKNEHEIIRIVCILFAIIFLVIIALVTTLSILGVMKTIYIWALLTTDIDEERTLIENNYHSSSNIQKLNKSLDRETMYSSVCLIVAGFGFQLTCACVVLLYGLLMNKIQAVYAWIIFSCTNVCCLGLLVMFLDHFTKLPVGGKGVDVCLQAFTIAVLSFNLLLYYHTKTMLENSRKKIIVKAYGGYTHTISPTLQNKQDNFIV